MKNHLFLAMLITASVLADAQIQYTGTTRQPYNPSLTPVYFHPTTFIAGRTTFGTDVRKDVDGDVPSEWGSAIDQACVQWGNILTSSAPIVIHFGTQTDFTDITGLSWPSTLTSATLTTWQENFGATSLAYLPNTVFPQPLANEMLGTLHFDNTVASKRDMYVFLCNSCGIDWFTDWSNASTDLGQVN